MGYAAVGRSRHEMPETRRLTQTMPRWLDAASVLPFDADHNQSGRKRVQPPRQMQHHATSNPRSKRSFSRASKARRSVSPFTKTTTKPTHPNRNETGNPSTPP